MPQHWQTYLFSVFLICLIPLLPLIFEVAQTGALSDETATLTGTMFPIGIAASSRNKIMLGVAIVASIFFAIAFGMIIGQGNPPSFSSTLSVIAIIFVLIAQMGERYNRHVVERAPFLEI